MANNGTNSLLSFLLKSTFLSNIKQNIDLKKENYQIKKKYAKEKIDLKPVENVTILGAPGSGKSTFFTQLQKINGCDFFSKQREHKIHDIRNYVINILLNILTEMPSLWPPVQLTSLQNKAMATLLVHCAKKSNFTELYQENLPYFLSLPNFIKSLWQDEAVQQTFNRSELCQTAYNIKYFIQRTDIIFQSNYMPSDQDILRYPATFDPPLREMYFKHEQYNLRIVDFTGVVNITQMWLSYFNGLKCGGLIYIVDCSSFDLVLSQDDRTKNQLRHFFNVFEALYRSRRYSPVLILLNKKDLLKEKILSGINFEDYFPEIQDFIPSVIENNDDHPNVIKVKEFISYQIVQLMTRLPGRFRWDSQFVCALNENEVKECLRKYMALAEYRF